MDNDHGITGELRRYASYAATDRFRQSMLAIADRIDAEHEAMLVDARKTVYQGYIELPKDADGEYIHVGDEMEGVDKYDSLKKVMGKVITVSYEADGIVDVAIQAWSNDGKSWHRAYLDPCASLYRHYHAPTVEDVLCELLDKVDDDRAGQAEIIAEYAAKLRLADDGKEQ